MAIGTATASGDDKAGTRPSPWRTIRWLGGGVILALAGWTAVQIAQYGYERFFQPPPIETQLHSLLAEAAKDHYRVTASRLVDFDGDGTKSRLIILRVPRGQRQELKDSDELRVYDVKESRLTETFHVRLLEATGPAYILRLTDARDLDGNGTAEVIVQLLDRQSPSSNRQAPSSIRQAPSSIWYQRLTRPFLLFWDFDSGGYSLAPLLGPEVISSRGPLLNGGPLSFLYQLRESVRDWWDSDATYRTFTASAIAVRTSQDGPVLSAAFNVDEHPSRPNPLYQVRTWRLYPDSLEGALAVRCSDARETVRSNTIFTAAQAIDRVLKRPRPTC